MWHCPHISEPVLQAIRPDLTHFGWGIDDFLCLHMFLHTQPSDLVLPVTESQRNSVTTALQTLSCTAQHLTLSMLAWDNMLLRSKYLSYETESRDDILKCLCGHTHRNPIDAKKARNSHGTLKNGPGGGMLKIIQLISIWFSGFVPVIYDLIC